MNILRWSRDCSEHLDDFVATFVVLMSDLQLTFKLKIILIFLNLSFDLLHQDFISYKSKKISLSVN